MKSRVLLLTLLLLSSACAEEEATGVLGSPSDVKTEPGVYDGYEILDDCPIESRSFAVRGTGTMWHSGAAPGSEGRIDALSDLASIVWEANRDAESLGGFGIGTACTLESGGGVNLILSDWREVDGVFTRTGPLLAERDLREEVSIMVAVAVPH